MAIREKPEIYDHLHNGHGERPEVDTGIRVIPISGLTALSPLEPHLENQAVVEIIEESDKDEKGMLVEAETGGIRMKVFKNRSLALKALAVVGTGIGAAATAAGIYFLNKHEGKWNLIPHIHHEEK